MESCNFRAIWTACYGKECMCLCRRVEQQMKRREEERGGGGGKKRGGRDLSSGCSVALCLNERTSLSLSPAVYMHGLCPLQQMSTCPEPTQRVFPSDSELEVNILQKLRLKVQLYIVKCFLNFVSFSRKLDYFILVIWLLFFSGIGKREIKLSTE